MNNIARNSAPYYLPADLKKGCAGLFFFLLSGLYVSGQAPPPSREYQLKAVFLFNFTQFVEWPQNAFASPADPFVIGILGDDPFGNYLEETVAGEYVMGHPLVIHHYHSTKDIANCHILFISSWDIKKVKDMLAETTVRNMLTVSDMDNFASLGGMIGFINYDNKIKLQIKPAAAKNANLNISSKLLRLADIID